MTISDSQATRSLSRKSSVEGEQDLCNEAIQSGDFDTMTDSEWVALCEQAAGKRRETAEAGELSLKP